MDDEALREFQNQLLKNPQAGEPLRGCGIIRKVRFGDESRGKGKRGGVRVVYVHTPDAERIDLITVYGKDEADNLSPDEVKELCKLARALRTELLTKAPKQDRKRKVTPSWRRRTTKK